MLHVDGYMIIPRAVKLSPECVAKMVKKANSSSAPIFNDNPVNTFNDRKRKQLDVNTGRDVELSAGLLLAVAKVKEQVPEANGMNISPWVGINSMPGCQLQGPHCDYSPSKQLRDAIVRQKKSFIPLAVLLAVMDGTKLTLWPKSIEQMSMSEEQLKSIEPIKPITLVIQEGDIVVFRADLVHAGSSYDEDNFRLHAYFDTTAVPRLHNDTWVVHKHASPEMRRIISFPYLNGRLPRSRQGIRICSSYLSIGLI